MNTEILTLQRDILLEQLMEIEEKLNGNGIKKEKRGFLFLLEMAFFMLDTLI